MAALVASAIGALFYNMLPLYLGLAQEYRELDYSATGMISGAFFLGYNLVTLSAFFWIRSVNWLVVTLVCAPVAALALYTGSLVDQYALFLMSTLVAGGGFSAIYGIATTAIGDTQNPSRWYAVKIAGEAALGALLFIVLPGTLVASNGFEGLVWGMVLAIALLLPLTLWLPSSSTKPTEDHPGRGDAEGMGQGGMPIWLALAGTLAFFSGQTTVWAFVERLGAAGDFDTQTVGNLLSATLFFAVGGSLTAAGLGHRFGNVKPFIAACFLFFASLILLTRSQSFQFYAAGTCAVTFSFGMGLPYVVARVAELDTGGRHVVLTVPAIGIGAMLGPALAGALATGDSLTPILGFSGIAVLLASLMIASPTLYNR